MSEYTINVCDLCGAERRSGTGYWPDAHAECMWRVPEDGVNGGSFRGTLCRRCRQRIAAAIRAALTSCFTGQGAPAPGAGRG